MKANAIFGKYVFPLGAVVGVVTIGLFIIDYFGLDVTERLAFFLGGLVLGLKMNSSASVRLAVALYGDEEINPIELSKIDFYKHYLEPSNELHVFRNSILKNIGYLLIATLLLMVGIFLYSSTRIFLPSGLVLLALYLAKHNVVSLWDRNPKLKIYNEGIWIEQIGFKPWKIIQKIEVRANEDSNTTEHYLDIFSMDLESADVSLSLDDLDVKVEKLWFILTEHHHKLKKESEAYLNENGEE